jgi:cytochrome c peroxidase
MKTMGVPDVNKLGLLDGTGAGYNIDDWGTRITNPDKQEKLQQMGKAAFYDMQVGGDGITACASCHFTAGADNRNINQMSPGLRRTAGGAGNDPAILFNEDFTHQLVGPNGELTLAEYGGAGSERGLLVSEAAVIAAGGTTDSPLDGAPAALPNPALVDSSLDVNDVVSSQGPRAMSFEGLHCKDAASADIDCDDPLAVSFPIADAANGTSPGRQDMGELDSEDNGNTENVGFYKNFNAAPIPNTVRHVEPRNTQTVYNAIFNQRSFFDGRADIFFNGVNTLGFRDPDAMVRVYTAAGSPSNGDTIAKQRMNVPFSSLASQALGPIGSVMEMVGHIDDGSGRPNHFMGKKLVYATPLFNQLVSCDDSLLGDLTNCEEEGTTNRGLAAPYDNYRAFVTEIYDKRFWGDSSGNDICLQAPDFDTVVSPSDCGIGSANRTLMELNFPMFFALAVQSYEATLFTAGNSIVEVLSGGVIPEGTLITNTLRKRTVEVDLGLPFPGNGNRPGGLENVGLNLEECIELVALNNSAAQDAIATQLCTLAFAKFIDPGAVAGSEAGNGPHQPLGGALVAGDLIGQCTGDDPTTPECQKAIASLLNIDEGLGRFQAGATACSVCHFDPTFTGATVAATTGFGAPPPEPFIPPGQLAREEPAALTERMIKFDGGIAIYDAGFYNIAVRPTAEDLGLGGREGEVPLAFTKLKTLISFGVGDQPFNANKIADIGVNLTTGVAGAGSLQLPTSMQVNGLGVTNLAPVPFQLTLACGPGLVGNGKGKGEPNNNPNVNCVPDIAEDEFLLRNGAFKAPSLLNLKHTAPYFHNGSKMSLKQVFAFYRDIGSLTTPTQGFPNMNLANLDAGLRVVGLSPEREAAVIEMMETGLTDWNSAFERGKYDHPELCVPLGHNDDGTTKLVGIPAVGASGNTVQLATFEDILSGNTGHAHDLTEPCTIPGVNSIDIPPVKPSAI